MSEQCQAKDPSTCKFHGSQSLNQLQSQKVQAEADSNFNAQFDIQQKIDSLTASTKPTGIKALNFAADKAYEVAGVATFRANNSAARYREAMKIAQSSGDPADVETANTLALVAKEDDTAARAARQRSFDAHFAAKESKSPVSILKSLSSSANGQVKKLF